jgi:carbon storage regulator
MLILSRKVRQEIVLGNGIRISVIAIRGKQVRVGIEAPPHFHIRREELEPLPAAAARAPAKAASEACPL